MSTEPSHEQKIALMKKTGIALREYTAPFIVAIYGDFGDGTGEIVGSGFLVGSVSEPIIVTANHVVTRALSEAFDCAGVSDESGRPPTRYSSGDVLWADEHLDVAAISHPVPKSIPHSKQLATSSCISKEAGSIDNDFLFIHGFPAVRSRFLPFGKPGVHSSTLAYSTVRGRSQYEWFNEDDFFAIEYRGHGQEDESDNPVDLPDPHGLSGSAVWACRLRPTAIADWQPSDARIVGVAQNWDDKSQSLVVTRIEVIYDQIVR